MAYFIEFKKKDNGITITWLWGPLQPDKYSKHGLEDRSIERKAKKWAKRLERGEKNLKCTLLSKEVKKNVKR